MRLAVEPLETRDLPAATAGLAGGVLTVLGSAGRERIEVALESAQVAVRDAGVEVGRFASAAVGSIVVTAGAGDDTVRLDADLTQPATLLGGAGNDLLQAGGGPAVLDGGAGRDKLIGGAAVDALSGGTGNDLLQGRGGADALDGGGGADKGVLVESTDLLTVDPTDLLSLVPDPPADPLMAALAENCTEVLAATEVEQLLRRAAAATGSEDAIIAIVDRNGRILGVRVEGSVDPTLLIDPALLTFAIDGAVAKARTGAFFGNDQAPLTSRTVQFISQSTVTEREVNSNPNVADPNSPRRGPGFVASVGVGGHFPPNITNTPQVDLFAIEHTNRDSLVHPGFDGIKGTADDVPLSGRFDIDPAFVPAGQSLFAPESYGFVSGLFPNGQSRGIATLPGGLPVYKNGCLVGGIGVFFPGKTGFATEENSALGTTFDPARPDRSLEAEYVAIAALGGLPDFGFPVETLDGVAPVAGVSFPLKPGQRIDLVGITLDIVGPGGRQGPENLFRYARFLPRGRANSGIDRPVTPAGDLHIAGLPVPTGWLVTPHDGVGVTAAEVEAIINAGLRQALETRAAIRLPLDSRTRMVFAVTDRTGEIVGLFRMPDATVFSIDVAVAKARNVAYYADPTQLQPADFAGVPPGTAFTNRTFRYLAEPRFPEAIDFQPPGPFSILNDGGADPLTGRQVGSALPASAHVSVLGFDAFHPGRNFRDPDFIQHQNGIVFFPGSAPLYRNAPDFNTGALIGGFGVSGDGVDQDDVVTFAGTRFFGVPNALLRADETTVRGVRLPYQKFNRNPEG